MNLFCDLTGKQGASANPAKQDETDALQANDAPPAVAPVSLPAPPLVALLGTAFLPAAIDGSAPAAQAERAPAPECPLQETAPPQALPWSSGTADIQETVIQPDAGAGFASAATALPPAEGSTSAPAERPGNQPAAEAPGPDVPAPAAAPERLPIPAAIRLDAALSGNPPPAAGEPSQTPVPLPPAAAAPVANANAPGDPAWTATLAFAYRLTPLARCATGPAQVATPVVAPSGTPASDNQTAPPDQPAAGPRALPNHGSAAFQPLQPEPGRTPELPAAASRALPNRASTAFQPLEPEPRRAPEPSAATSRMPSDTMPAASALPSSTRSAQPAAPAARPAAPAAAPPPEPAGPPGPPPAAHEIRLRVSDASQRVDVRLTEHAGQVQVAVRTPDARLAGALREDLTVLSARLEQAGFRAESWQPGGWTSGHRGQPPAETAALGAAAHGQETDRHNHPQQQESESQRRTPPREPGGGRPAPEFSGLLESLD